MNYQWKTRHHMFSPGEDLYVGAWSVGSVFYDGGRSRNEPNKYMATCKLPGMKPELGHFLTTGEAKAKALEAAVHWFNKAEA